MRFYEAIMNGISICGAMLASIIMGRT